MRRSFEDTYKRPINRCGAGVISTVIEDYASDPTAKFCIRVNVQSVSGRTEYSEDIFDILKKNLPEHYAGIPVVVQTIEMSASEN